MRADILVVRLVSGFDGGDGEFAAVGEASGGEEFGSVGADCGFGDAELAGDGFVGQGLDEQVEHGTQIVWELFNFLSEIVIGGIVFTCCEIAAGQDLGRARSEHLLPGVGLPD